MQLPKYKRLVLILKIVIVMVQNLKPNLQHTKIQVKIISSHMLFLPLILLLQLTTLNELNKNKERKTTAPFILISFHQATKKSTLLSTQFQHLHVLACICNSDCFRNAEALISRCLWLAFNFQVFSFKSFVLCLARECCNKNIDN